MKKRLFASLLALCFILVNTLSTPFAAFDQEFTKVRAAEVELAELMEIEEKTEELVEEASPDVSFPEVELTEEEVSEEVHIEEATVEEGVETEELEELPETEETTEAAEEVETTEEPETTEDIYLDGVGGDDANDGSSPELAVKTFERAKEIATQYPSILNIYVIGQVDVVGDVSLAGTNAYLVRGLNYNGFLLRVARGTTATLSNITIDGNWLDVPTATKSLIDAYGTLIINDGTVL